MLYSFADQIIVLLIQMSHQDGALWWYAGHSEMATMLKAQKVIRVVRWAAEGFMPAYMERFRHATARKETIGFQDWNEKVDALMRMEEMTQVVSNESE